VCERTAPSPRLASSPRAPGGGRVVGVTPVGGCGAAGEHTALVSRVQRAADVVGEEPILPADVDRLGVRAEHDPADAAVAGQPAGAGGGDDRAEAGAGCAVPGVRVDEVTDADGDHHMRRGRAQSGQVAGGEGVVGPLHQGVAQLLAAAAGVAGGPGGLHHRLQHRLDLLPADRVELEAAGAAAVGVPYDRQHPLLGRVGFGAVGVEACQVVVHHLRQLLVRASRRGVGEHPVDRGDVHVGGLSGGQMLVPRHRRDHRDLLGGHPPLGERLGHRGQVLQCPPGAHQPVRRACREPTVTAQPGLHRLQPVDLRSLGQLPLPHRTRDLGVQPVGRP